MECRKEPEARETILLSQGSHYPAMLTDKTFTNDDLTLNYAEGPKVGPPILFLQGLTDRWQFFIPIMSAMTQR